MSGASSFCSGGIKLAFVTLVAGACGLDGSASGGDAIVSDSAGVDIVENRAPLLDDAAAWHLAETPTLQIGAVEDGDDALVRVARVRTLRDGRIAVCDVGYHQIRVFGPDGAFIRSIGREGEGPGEFQTCARLDQLPGDTLLVFDLFVGRVTLFDRHDELITTLPLRPPDPSGGFSYLARLADGTYLAKDGTNPMYLGLGSGLIRGAGWISRLDARGRSLGKILEFRTGEGLVPPEGGYIGVHLARQHFTAAGPEGLVLGFADRFQFDVYDFDGRLKRRVRRAGDPEPVTRQDIEDELERSRNSGSDFAREHIDDMEFPETHPAYDALLVDTGGNVWVRNYRRRDAEGPERWSVFDPDGRWTTDVLVPDDLRIMEIGTDYMLAVWQDDLDVQYLRRYELIK